MSYAKFLRIAAAASALALSACEARFGNDAAQSAEGNGSAENKAEDGRVTVSAPGFEMKLNIPEGIRRQANIDRDNDVIYPGSSFGGIHVEGGARDGNGERGGQVELTFTTGDGPDAVARWYRDPARTERFTVETENREGAALVIAGTRRDGGRFSVRLSPREGGGTSGRALLRDGE